MSIENISIENKKIGSNYPPFIIAEMSGNHNQSLERAIQIVEAAAKTGAQALKLQTYTAETMTLNIRNGAFLIDDPKSLWNGETLYDLYKKALTPWEWHQPIFDRCRELGLIAFSTPFDASSFNFLERLNVPAYKIASFENTDLPLIKKVAATGKPMLISTGMASIGEMDETVRVAREAGCSDLVLLKCTSTYPASPENTNIATLPHLKDLFKTQVGLSDHTMGIGTSIAGVALGATVIEKHFTLSRAEGGVDSAFSLEPDELKALVVESKRAWQSLGQIQYGPTEKENASIAFRRSLYIAEDIQKGTPLNAKNLRAIRPGFGLPPKYYELLLGKPVNQDIKKGTPMSWDLIG
jgi:pseudaminic acid synthase